jgi:hypothetical protein
MITYIRSVNCLPGKFSEAVVWAKELAAIVARVTGREVKVASAIGNDPNTICWIAEFENLGQVEDDIAKYSKDGSFLGIVARSADLVLPGSTRDQIWRHI